MDREIEILKKLIPEDVAREIVDKLRLIETKQTSETTLIEKKQTSETTTISENTYNFVRYVIQELKKRGV